MYALQCSDNSIMMYDMMKKKITITITGMSIKTSLPNLLKASPTRSLVRRYAS